MKKITRDIITAFLFICVIFGFCIKNLKPLKDAIKADLLNVDVESFQASATKAQDDFRDSFHGKGHLVDIYGVVQLGLGKNMIGNFEFVKDTNEFMHMLEPNMDVSTFNSDMIQLSKKLQAKNIPLLYVQIPAREIKGYTQLPTGLNNASNSIMDNMLANIKENDIDYLDIRENLQKGEYSKEKFFFKTDVHPRTETGVWIDRLIVKQLEFKDRLTFPNQEEVFNQKNYSVITEQFLGNLGKSSGKYFTGLDEFNMFLPKYATNYTVMNNVDSSKKTGSFESVLMNGQENNPGANYNTYWITNYLEWPNPYYSIVNHNVKENNLLVLMDSNGLGAISYLSLLAHNVTIVDTRYIGIHDYVDQALNSQKYDAVIVLQGTSLAEGIIFPKVLQNPQAEILSTTTPTQIERGKKYDINITVKNTGTESWSEKKQIRLCIFQDGMVDKGYRVKIPEGMTVKPGEEYTFVLHDFQAPPNNSTYLIYQMVEEGVQYFGQQKRVDISIK